MRKTSSARLREDRRPWTSISSSSARARAVRRPRSRPPSSASTSPSPSVATASAASRSTPGTIPSKTLREAVLDAARRSARSTCSTPPASRRPSSQALQQLMDRAARVIAAETAVVREQFRRNCVGLLPGQATFVDDHTRPHQRLGRADPRRADRHRRRDTSRRGPGTVAFDDRTIIDSDGVLQLEHRVPRTMTVVGAGVIGVEYASMFGALGTKVTVVDQRERVLNFLDGEIGEAFQYLLRRRNVTFRLREKVERDRARQRPSGARVGWRPARRSCPRRCSTPSGGRATTESPRARAHGPGDQQARPDPRRRHSPHERAAHLRRRRRRRAGGLAATAMEQGRVAALSAFDQPVTR